MSIRTIIKHSKMSKSNNQTNKTDKLSRPDELSRPDDVDVDAIPYIYNGSFGAYQLSERAYDMVAQRKGIAQTEPQCYFESDRSDPDVVAVIQELKEDANDSAVVDLHIKWIPKFYYDNKCYECRAHGGCEKVILNHDKAIRIKQDAIIIKQNEIIIKQDVLIASVEHLIAHNEQYKNKIDELNAEKDTLKKLILLC